MRLSRRHLDRFAAEDGYTLPELLAAFSILGIVLGSLIALFVSGARSEIHMNERFRAQQEARLALSRLRRDVHCAKTATVSPANPGSLVSLAPPVDTAITPYCPSAQPVTWCTVELAANRHGLYRKQGTSCDASGVRVADHLTAGSVFSYAKVVGRLATVGVNLPVDVDTKDARAAYRLEDSIALRKSGRA